MKPYKSSSDKENCSPISSNCVIWQGPDLLCINLCKGDSVSDVVYKLATELCAIKDATNMDNVDFNCLLNECANTTNPEVTVAGIIQLIIDNVCCSVTGLRETTDELTARTSDLYTEPILLLPTCLQYIDPFTGLPVTTLPLSEYAVATANAFCDLKATVTTHTSQISNLTSRVVVLENEPPYTLPSIVPTCTYGTVVSGVPAQMDVVVSNLDIAVCGLTASIGTTTNILNAASQQCNLLGSQTALSQSGTMSSLAGWNNTISNLAQSMQNLWLTVCDMRSAIYDVKQCCGQADCSAFFLGYTANANTARDQVTLIFNALTVIPAGFANCPLLSTVTISDGNGNIYSDTLDLVALSTNPSGVTYTVSGASLNPALDYTVTVTGCIVKDGNTCSKIVSNGIYVPTTTTTTTTIAPCTCYQWRGTADAGDISAATGNTNTSRNGKVFVEYYECGSLVSSFITYSSGAETSTFCSCLIPYAYYYASDVQVIASSGTIVLESLCPTP